MAALEGGGALWIGQYAFGTLNSGARKMGRVFSLSRLENITQLLGRKGSAEPPHLVKQLQFSGSNLTKHTLILEAIVMHGEAEPKEFTQATTTTTRETTTRHQQCSRYSPTQ